MFRSHRLEQLLEQHGPDEPTVTVAMNDDLYLRSYTGRDGKRPGRVERVAAPSA
jgi:sulfur carrier protein ThiS